MDLFAYYQRHRTSQQRIQTQNQANGDRGRREILLHAPGLRLFEDGSTLEVKTHRKRRQQPVIPQETGKKNFTQNC